MTDEGVGVWVYAITRAEGAADRTAGLRGVSEEPIRTVLGRDLAAVVGTVSLDVFRAASSPHDLKELDWSTAEVRAHNAVVRTVGRSGSVIPVPMATIYRDDWRVCQLLLNEYDDFRSALPRISGREELGVKAYADPKSVALGGDSIQLGSAESRSRTAHLLRRRRLLASHEEAYRLAVAEADRVHAVLMRHAVDGKRKPLPDNDPSTSKAGTVLNEAYLVDGDTVELFRETVAELDRSMARIRLEVTGPLPPYSFAGDLVAV
jgi:hypothetical protein